MLKHATITRPSSRLAHIPIQKQINKIDKTCETHLFGLDETDNCDLISLTVEDTSQNTASCNEDLKSHSLTALESNGQSMFARRNLDFSPKQKIFDNDYNRPNQLSDCKDIASIITIIPKNESIKETNTSFNNNDISNCTTPSPLSSPFKSQSNSKMSLATHLLSPNRNRKSPTKMLGLRSLSRSINNHFQGDKLEEESSDVGRVLQSQSFRANNNSQSMIKVFAQTLSQDVEYKTLQVTSQTRSSQIVRSLLKKFRLKHRDPNLYYLTLERWIRKDGIKSRNVMILSDDACPLQLQQCCSNPPHNDIKFTLQIRIGALVKIYCSDVVQDARYKCLSLSAQTTVEETIDLMVQCLNLGDKSASSDLGQPRITSSPCSIMSTHSSSSGIESDPNPPISSLAFMSPICDDRLLNNDSRASSITSISTSSNTSTLSSSLIDQYCLIIECKDTNYRRVLDSDEYLVDVYQGLLAEAKGHHFDPVDTTHQSPTTPNLREKSSRSKSQLLDATPTKANNLNAHNFDFVKTNPDQWFLIKLVRRDEFNLRQQFPMSAIKLTNPTHSPPPQIPSMPESMMRQFNSSTVNMKNVVTTTQIEVTNGHFSSHSFSGLSNGNNNYTLNSNKNFSSHKTKNNDSDDKPPSLPPKFILLPPIKPRRNISMGASSFGPPLILPDCTTATTFHSLDNRRRYDPARLAEDLSQLDIENTDE